MGILQNDGESVKRRDAVRGASEGENSHYFHEAAAMVNRNVPIRLISLICSPT